MKHKYKIIFGLIGLMIFIVLLFSLAQSIGEDAKEVKCYDKFSNEIKGETCLEDPVTQGDAVAVGLIGTIFLAGLIFMGGMLDMLLEDEHEN